MSLLLVIGALTVALLWPYYDLTFRFDPEELLDAYVDADQPASMGDMHHRLALQIKADWRRNGRIVRHLRELFQVALIALLAEIVVWMLAVAACSPRNNRPPGRRAAGPTISPTASRLSCRVPAQGSHVITHFRGVTRRYAARLTAARVCMPLACEVRLMS